MANRPIITFKAGACDFDTSVSPPRVLPKPTPGYLYLFEEDELMHFCWRPRSASMNQPELELIMVPADGRFTPYQSRQKDSTSSRIHGRIFVLRFQSSTQRHFFWLQSRSQHAHGDPTWFSPRDLALGQFVDRLLQGDEVNVQEELANISNNQDGNPDDDDSTSRMEDVRSEGQAGAPGNSSAGNPLMGDPGDEGKGSREGGADGGRAAAIPSSDAAAAVQNFLRSMQGNQALGGQHAQPQSAPFTTLPDLLLPSTTIPIIDDANETFANTLLNYVPPACLLLSQQGDNTGSIDPNPETVKAAIEALSLNQRKEILRKVLRSPQFSQSLSSLTVALRDGGLPSIGDALGIPIENGGFMRRGGVPTGGGDAVKAFLDGVKVAVEKEGETETGDMDTS
ncbi:hypothetical protein MMC22_008019 [Lobaria immixta]|nr:hypothetical protein [Lobaria immixta]